MEKRRKAAREGNAEAGEAEAEAGAEVKARPFALALGENGSAEASVHTIAAAGEPEKADRVDEHVVPAHALVGGGGGEVQVVDLSANLEVGK